ncbi:hypothetical protein [Moraxella oblonga]|uniref:hypothetical protein n=1 Tax=Moraxella oblonga TaxID=200413 RepID=UPI0008317CE4|nr:hypothetical protein [Moraxella oblonga]
MIEIAVHEIANYDMVQILQKAKQGEKVALIYNGTTFDITPSKPLSEEEKKFAILDNIFATVQAKLPPDFKFNREELYEC